MRTVSQSLSGKTAGDENFPVASRLIARSRRPIILAFYRFVRAADDVADNPGLSADEKLALLDHLADALRSGARDPEAEPLRLALRTQGIAPKHALDLLDAFRLDAKKNRYANLDELMDYCSLSAMPVGRFVLDVHGQSRSLWPASDAICAALQVINHLQDCGEDYRRLDRVYLPQSILEAHGAAVEMLGERRASPQLQGAIAELARHAGAMVERGGELVSRIADVRLSLEIAAIHALARELAGRLQHRDPLSQSVHLSKFEFGAICGLAAARRLARTLAPRWKVKRRTRA
ncbi:MAG TPA: squalene synthase HpnC [Roseiarcus sp.]|jgi:squalene synthase HpnC|nr:squalene synthase HpnC [Roseiarcus sp.]